MPGQEVEGDNAALVVGGMAGEETKVEGYAVVKGDSEVGVAGYDHGVKEAEKRNESENASKLACGLQRHGLMRAARYLDTTSAGVRDTQNFHLHQGTAYGCCHSQGRQGAQRMGLGYWEKETERGQVRLSLVYISRWMEARGV